MRVLMVNRPDAPSHHGGDLTVMRKTAEALRPLGVAVEESFDPEPDGAGFDLAHVFNLRSVRATAGQVRRLKRAGLPVVMTPLYFNPSRALWGVHALNHLFGTPRPAGELDRLLGELRDRNVSVRTPGGEVLAADSQARPLPDYDRLQRETLRDVDHLLPGGLLEAAELMKTLRAYDVPFTVAPHGADALQFLGADPEPFVRKYGVRDFVLQVGRVEDHKNQLLLVYALRGAGLPVVLVGAQPQAHYVDWCRRYGPKDLMILPYLPAAEMAGAYAAARVHALPGWAENCGLVSLEAALAGCAVVVSTAGFEVEYFRDLAEYCDPADVDSIRRAVARAYDGYDRDAARRLRLKQLILSEYTWERAAAATFRAYGRALGR